MLTAKQILDTYWNGELPVQPDRIAKAMGISLIADESMGYDGHYQMDDDGNASIRYSPNVSDTRKRFTLAHELGHHAHGDRDAQRDTRDNFSSRARNPIEVAANRFAAALIMPKEDIEVAVFERNIFDVARLARLFGVSQLAMEYRLKNLGIL